MYVTAWKTQNLEPEARLPRPFPPKLLCAIALLITVIITILGGSQSAFRLHSDDEEGVHLAVSPRCGGFSDAEVADVNAGINLQSYKTIVAFGDSYTDGGKQDGSPLDPAVLMPPNPLAGGRSTNGKVWIEHIADAAGARLMDYAQSGACTDLNLWPSNPRKVDFVGQVRTFLSQENRLDSETTLYVVFFGINDYEASKHDGDHLQAAATAILREIQVLATSPMFARSFLIVDVYGRGDHTCPGEAYRHAILSGLREFHFGHNVSVPLNVAFADLSRIWDGVLGSNPGYQAFGYTSTEACTICNERGCTMEGMCDDPEHYFYWIPGHPSKETMRIMADYIQGVLHDCAVL